MKSRYFFFVIFLWLFHAHSSFQLDPMAAGFIPSSTQTSDSETRLEDSDFSKALRVITAQITVNNTRIYQLESEIAQLSSTMDSFLQELQRQYKWLQNHDTRIVALERGASNSEADSSKYFLPSDIIAKVWQMTAADQQHLEKSLPHSPKPSLIRATAAPQVQSYATRAAQPPPKPPTIHAGQERKTETTVTSAQPKKRRPAKKQSTLPEEDHRHYQFPSGKAPKGTWRKQVPETTTGKR